MTRRDIDHAIATLASAQGGVFVRRQALAEGASAKMIRARVATGQWQVIGDGVYRLRGWPPTWRGQLFAAVLGTAGVAAVSHHAAAVLHGIATFDGEPVAITVRHGGSRVAHLGDVHQSRRLLRDHVVVVDGLPVTSVARTLIDLAATERRGRIEIALDRALATKALTINEFLAVVDDLSGGRRRGMRTVRELAVERVGSYVPPSTVAESLLVGALRRGGLPRPVLQFPHPGRGFEGRRVDAAYPNARLLIEVDSRSWHGGWVDMERDRERDVAAAAVGYRTLRFAVKHLAERPEWVADQVRAALEVAAA